MKNLPLIFLVMIGCFTGYSQNVGINSDGNVSNVSAMLDIKSATKGLLISKFSLVQRDAV